ncbi:MAG: hypothetical protein KBS45_00075 [Clostridiales bacterium]|nr:hypothetical protein [Candidatus Coliplasma caballi]
MSKRKRNTTRFTGIALFVLCAAVLLASCGAETRRVEQLACLFEEHLTDRSYYTGDEFDSTFSDETGTHSRVPSVYAIYSDGTLSEELSHSGKVTFSGYDLSVPGKQTVNAVYSEDGVTVSTTYTIDVVQTETLFIEAEDPFRRSLGSFHVGEAFSLSYDTEDGVKRGVTVSVHYNNPNKPRASFFGDAPELAEAVFDTSLCKLDESGRFTEAGVFSVTVTLGNAQTTYEILVED